MPSTAKGVIIARTVPGGPAEQSGLQQGDVISKIDGQAVTSGKEVQELIRKHKPSDTLNFLVSRNGSLTPVPTKLGDFPTQEERQD